MKLRRGYGLAALIVFAIEVVIFLYVRDGLVRPYLGDVLVVILMYLALRAITPLPVLPAAALTFLIAIAVEFSQMFRLAERLGLSGTKFGEAALGSFFDLKDMACYAIGVAFVVVIEILRREQLR